MRKARRMLAVCLVVSAIASVMMILVALLGPEKGALPASASSAVVPAGLGLFLASPKSGGKG